MSDSSCTQLADACPACQQADLRPYGNGSKWICPACKFVLPCCEGGELSPVPERPTR